MALIVAWPVLTGAASAQLSRWGAAAPPKVPPTVRLEPAGPAPAGAPVLRVGLHVRNIYSLSLVDQSFLAEGWYWLDWGPDVQALLQRNQIDPVDMIELSNEIELAQYSTQTVSPGSEQLVKPGRFGRTIRFSGKFYVQEVPQYFAPFDPQKLLISLEVKPEILASGPDRLRLEPANRAGSIVGEDLRLSGYELDSVDWQLADVVYEDELLPEARFSRLSAVFVYGKNESSMFLKWIFPVLIVMAIVILSPSIEGVLGDVRLAIPPSALLTLVVMQDTYKNSFPPAPYLTYLDELYVYSYIVCLAIFLLFLAGTNIVSQAGDEDRGAIRDRVNRIDTVVQVSTIVGFVVVAVVGWFT